MTRAGKLVLGAGCFVWLVMMACVLCRFWVWQELNVGLIVDQRVRLDLVILSVTENIHGRSEIG